MSRISIFLISAALLVITPGVLQPRGDLRLILLKGAIAGNRDVELAKPVGECRGQGEQIDGRIGNRLACGGQDSTVEGFVAAIDDAIYDGRDSRACNTDEERHYSNLEEAIDNEVRRPGRSFPCSRPHHEARNPGDQQEEQSDELKRCADLLEDGSHSMSLWG